MGMVCDWWQCLRKWLKSLSYQFIPFCHHTGHFRNDESLIDAALTVNDRPKSRIPPSAEIKMNKESKNTKQTKNKILSPSTNNEITENLTQECTLSNTNICEENLELKVYMDTCSTRTDAKSLAKENFKLKEQRLCKVLHGFISVEWFYISCHKHPINWWLNNQLQPEQYLSLQCLSDYFRFVWMKKYL